MRHAVAGIVRRDDGAVFTQQRCAPQSFAGCWEFPGGKVKPGENAADALRRELREEIGITARRIRHFVRRRHRYDNGDEILLDFFIVTDYNGAPRACENQPWRWAAENAMPSPLLAANGIICKWLRLPPLYAITMAEVLGVSRALLRLRELLAAGQLRLLQLRDKNLPPPERESFTRAAAALCRDYGALLLINDDENLAAVADGLHLSARRLMQCRARPEFAWVGASCHNAAEVKKAAALNLDFAVLSPVCQTPTHADAPPLGWQKFSQIAMEGGIPVYALGGMRADDLAHAFAHNACGIAMMRRIWQ